MLMMTGCMSIFGPDTEGWRSDQKDAFLEILKTDKYMSICDQEKLYQRVKKSRESKLMSKLLIAYVNNLENSCIDIKHFNAVQDRKKAQKIETYFDMNQKEIDSAKIIRKLSAGQSIEEILKPHVPRISQFKTLTKVYNCYKRKKKSKSKLKKIRLNIERTKLMPLDIGTHYALINVPEFKIHLVEDGNTSMKFPVIVGQRNMQTPIFSETMKYIEINPQWNVPDSIMRKTYIPKIKNNPSWVKASGMELHKESYDLNSPKVNPASVDWSKYPQDGKGVIPYKLVQIPSRKNGLGRVKFIFPNKHAVYMHDTQEKKLFKRKIRTFSHGCIRLGKPKALLNHVTTHYSSEALPTVKKWYNSTKTKHLMLSKELRVHTVYFTAFISESGVLKRYPDVYGFDKSQKLNFKL